MNTSLALCRDGACPVSLALTQLAADRGGKSRVYERAVHRKGIGAIQQAPDAVQSVESDSLTEGYKSKFPLFHKLFLSGVEKGGGTAGD
jgi:hypothetical protein